MNILFQCIVGNNTGGSGTIDDNIDLATTTLEILVVYIQHHETPQQHQQRQHRIEHDNHAIRRDDIASRGKHQ